MHPILLNNMSQPLDPHDNNTERVCISMHTRDLARIDRAANEIGERSRSKFCRDILLSQTNALLERANKLDRILSALEEKIPNDP
jgi:metal-responsive CopG/Arc/MetJ family transcriptional regulator